MMMRPNEILTQFCIGYRPIGMIADRVLPIVPAPDKVFQYQVRDRKVVFAPVNDLLGRTGTPNTIEDATSWTPAVTQDRGLLADIPINEIRIAKPPYNPKQQAAMNLMDALALGREKRVADLVFAHANYASSNKLDVTHEWDDTTNSHPLADIAAALAACFYPPNTMVFGAEAWAYFREHPEVIASMKPLGAGTAGVVSVSDVVNYFSGDGIEQVLIGNAKYDAQPKGKTAVYGDLWGDACALLHVPSGMSGPNVATFGCTFGFNYGGGFYNVQEGDDMRRGDEGVVSIKTACSLLETIVAADLGFLLYDLKTNA